MVIVVNKRDGFTRRIPLTSAGVVLFEDIGGSSGGKNSVHVPTEMDHDSTRRKVQDTHVPIKGYRRRKK